MQGRLEGFADNQGYPRYNEGIRALDCGSGVTISCDAEQCGVIVFTDSNGIVNKVFAAPLLIFAKNVNDSECRVETDNRLSDIGTQPYVQVCGYRADNTECFEKHFSLSLFPENGQTAESLKVAIIAAICACTAAALVEPDNGLEIVEGGRIGLGGTLIQDTTISSNKSFGIALVDLLKLYVSADEVDFEVDGSFSIDSTSFNVQSSGIIELNSASKEVKISADAFFYFGETVTDGSWRVGTAGANFVFQKRESGIWVTKQTITP